MTHSSGFGSDQGARPPGKLGQNTWGGGPSSPASTPETTADRLARDHAERLTAIFGPDFRNHKKFPSFVQEVEGGRWPHHVLCDYEDQQRFKANKPPAERRGWW